MEELDSRPQYALYCDVVSLLLFDAQRVIMDYAQGHCWLSGQEISKQSMIRSRQSRTSVPVSLGGKAKRCGSLRGEKDVLAVLDSLGGVHQEQTACRHARVD